MDDTAHSTGITKSRKSSHVFTWTVENFETEYAHGVSEDGNKISSPVFEVLHPDGKSTTCWIVDITVKEDMSVSAFLVLKSCPKNYLKRPGLKCKFSIHVGTKTNSKVLGYGVATDRFTESSDSWGWEDFTTLERLRAAGLLTGDRLQFCIDMTIFSKPKSTVTSTFTSGSQVMPLLEPVLGFESLFGAHELSNIKIQCGSETFPAHKGILAGRSAVFKAMLTSDMEEVKSGIIHVTDMTSDTFGIILRYMYTGKMDPELGSNSLLDVIYGAEKYGLIELKNYCFQKLAGSIHEENVGDVAVAAYLYGAEETVKVTLRKFIEPRFFELVKSEEFKALVQKHMEAFF